MVRRRQVLPDTAVYTQTYGEIPVVSDEAWITAVVEAAQVQAFSGGVVTTLVHRHPTDLEGEMVTTHGVIEWKDRTDAKAQPEAHSVMAEPAPEPEPVVEEPSDEEPQEPLAESPDGFDHSRLDEEDVAAIPEPLR